MLPPVRRARHLRPHPRPGRRALRDQARGRVRGQPGLPGPDHGAGDDLPDRGRHRGADRRDGGRPQRARPRPGRRVPRGAAAPAGLHGRGDGRRGQLRPAPGVRPDPPDSRRSARRAGCPGRRGPAAAVRAGRLPGRRGHRARPPAPDRRADADVRAPARAAMGPAAGGLGRGRDRGPVGGHGGRLAVLVCDSPDLRGAMARPGPPFRPGAAGADVRADRGHRGRAHHVAARDDRRRAELGLPLHLGPRRQPDHGGAVGGGVPRRSGQVLRLPGRRGSVSAATRGRPADHVRDRGRARPVRARAAAPGRVAGQPAGAGGQRRMDPAAARRVRRAARRRAAADRAAGRAGPGHAAVPRRRGGHRGQPLEGEGPGDLGDSRRAARFPLLQADVLGGAGPGDRPGPAARRRRRGSRPGRPRGTRSGRPSWSTAGTPRSAPSPRRSAARISTPRT